MSDVSNGGLVRSRAMIMQPKARRPAQFAITARTREAVTEWIRAVQLLLGHARLESTVRHLGFEVDDALELAEQTDV